MSRLDRRDVPALASGLEEVREGSPELPGFSVLKGCLYPPWRANIAKRRGERLALWGGGANWWGRRVGGRTVVRVLRGGRGCVGARSSLLAKLLLNLGSKLGGECFRATGSHALKARLRMV